jgi:hypothetical protein
LNRMVVFGGRDIDGAPLADGGIFVPAPTKSLSKCVFCTW